jgi:ATP-dependent Clp protease ATP-binding subunit ClpB
VRRKPYSVVLFDEIEKAHPDVFNLLLQILDDGRLTDGQGRVVNFRNTVLIMTSNIASTIIETMGSERERMDQMIREEMRKYFRPEFLNRVDEIIIFHALSREDVEKIVDIQIRRILARLEERKIRLELSQQAKDYLAQKGYDPAFGARPLKRTIQREILDPLSLKLLQGSFQEGDKVRVDYDGHDHVVFSKA